MVSLGLFAASYSWISWQNTKTDAIRHGTEIADLGEKALNSYFSQFVVPLDLSSQDLLDAHGRMDLIFAQSRLSRLTSAHPDLLNANIVSLDGVILLGTTPGAKLPAPLVDESTFNESVTELSKGKALSIGRPFVGPFSKEWIIPLRYAVRDSDGKLRYVLTTTLPLSAPQIVWKDMALPKRMALGLIRDDGYLVSRYPVPIELDLTDTYGKPRTGSLIKHLQDKQFPASGHVEGQSSLEGPNHLIVFRRLSDYPLSFFVTQPLSNIRAIWWSNAQIPFLLMLLLLAGGYVVFRRAVRAQTVWEADRKQAEQALMAARDAAELANRAKDSFLATTSHEIRTPLGGLMGMLELLGLTPLNEEQRETLLSARDSGRSLLRILDDLLDWSKIQAGELELSPQPTSISHLVAGVVNTYARVASARSLVLAQEVDAGLSPALIVDPLRLSQVLNNFVSNALKFTHKGGVTVRAELLGRGDGTERVRFSVTDSGIGINKEVLPRLFQNYGQGSADTARMYGGTGLGLAICRRLADLLDGRIEVRSAPGEGSTFSITLSLPVSEVVAQKVQRARITDESASVPRLVEAGAQREAPLVLVVDDHPTNRRLLALQLGLLGLRTETAENGEAALPMWREGRYAAVITDCHMPKMDGYALAQVIRAIETDERRRRTPIIAWTANALAQEKDHCHAVGMDDVLVKPAELVKLRAVLQKLLAPAATMPAAPLDIFRAGPGGTADAPIDLAALEKIAANAADRAEILGDFMAQVRADLAELEAARDDLAANERLLHRMKGACRTVGARELEAVCEALQGAARQGNSEDAHAAHAALNRAMARLEAHLAPADDVNKENK